MKRIILVAMLAALIAAPVAAQMKTRESVGIEGFMGWFPEDRGQLKAMVDKYLAAAGDVKVEGKPIAIIAPHAGYQFSGATAAYAYKPLFGQTYDRVVIIAPSHDRVGFAGGHIGDWDYYSTPLGASELDKIACRKLLVSKICNTQPRADAQEHSLQNQIPFLQTVLPGVKIVPIIVGGPQTDENIRRLGDEIRSVTTADTLFVISSDFTHYGERFYYTPIKEGSVKEGVRKLDQGAIDLICANNLKGFRAYMAQRDAPTICGAEPIAVLLRILEGRKDIRGALVQYANSGDRTGDYAQNAVSYAAIVLSKIPGAGEVPLEVKTVVEVGPGKDKPEPIPDKVSEDDQKLLLLMAREQLVKVVAEKKVIDPRDYRWDMSRKILSQGATFVTLTNNERLRGCIGDILPSKPIYLSVLRNTINAWRDPRFTRDPITAAELPKIEIEITVLTPFVIIPSYTDIVVGKHGVYMEKGAASAIFLPQVATEQKWDRDTMLQQLSLKARLDANAYKEPGCKFWVFEGQIFNESEMRRKEAEKEKPRHWND